MNYLRYNATTFAAFLAVGAMTVFIPLPEGLDSLTVLILIVMLGAFYVASLFSLPEKLASSVFGVVLSVSSSLIFSACVVILTLAMAYAVHGC